MNWHDPCVKLEDLMELVDLLEGRLENSSPNIDLQKLEDENKGSREHK